MARNGGNPSCPDEEMMKGNQAHPWWVISAMANAPNPWENHKEITGDVNAVPPTPGILKVRVRLPKSGKSLKNHEGF